MDDAMIVRALEGFSNLHGNRQCFFDGDVPFA